MISPLYEELEGIGWQALGAWVERVDRAALPSGIVVKLRFWLVPGGFVDVFAAVSGRFAFHYEGREAGRGIYRHDNAPHGSALACPTWPRHCHAGREGAIGECALPEDLPGAFRTYCGLLIAYLSETP